MDERLNNSEWLKVAYETRTLEDIATELGCGRNTVRNRLITFGIDRRARCEHFKGKSKPVEQRAKMSETRKAYWDKHPDREAFKLKISKSKQRGGSKNGRTRRYIPGRGQMLVHRLIAEELTGRPLKSHEHVHHKDHDPHHNEPDNFEILSPAEHGRLHYYKRAPKGSGGLAAEWRKRVGVKRDSKGRFTK